MVFTREEDDRMGRTRRKHDKQTETKRHTQVKRHKLNGNIDNLLNKCCKRTGIEKRRVI